jgi:hypothetical protein
MDLERGDENQALNDLKHNIKNELSSITLALEQLKYEIHDKSEDFDIYFQMISLSASKIDKLLINFNLNP